eukprot:7121604-Prymnesium_polylepis.1
MRAPVSRNPGPSPRRAHAPTMPPKRRNRNVIEDDPVEQRPGSGQSPESLASDLAAQPELLAAAAELLKRQ